VLGGKEAGAAERPRPIGRENPQRRRGDGQPSGIGPLTNPTQYRSDAYHGSIRTAVSADDPCFQGDSAPPLTTGCHFYLLRLFFLVEFESTKTVLSPREE
jgi:hypothetical protein